MIGLDTVLQDMINSGNIMAQRESEKARERGSEPMLCGIPICKIEEVLLNNPEEIKLFGLSAENILTFFAYYKMKNGHGHITLDSIVEAFGGGEDQGIKIKSLEMQNELLLDMVNNMLDEKVNPPVIYHDR